MKARILVIRGGAIGDFILTLPAIRLLRENFPGTHLEILGYEHIIALAHGRFYADAIHSIEYGAMAGFFAPDSALEACLATYFASFQQVVSYLYDPDGFFEGNLRRAGVKNLLPAYVKIDDSQHASRQLARPLEQLAIYLEDHAAYLYPAEVDRTFAAQFLGESGASTIALHPGSGSPRKNWPLENWATLGPWLTHHPSRPRILLIGGEADQERFDRLIQEWPEMNALIARNLPLPQLAAVLERCRLFIGHDSGISHLAAAVGTRCVLLFGPTDPAVWAPGNAGARVLQAPCGDLARLSVDEVQATIEQILAN